MIEKLGILAKKSSLALRKKSTAEKNRLLEKIADGLIDRREQILSANLVDLKNAKDKKLNEAMLDRLSIETRLDDLAKDIRYVATLPDPVGEVIEEKTMENGLALKKVRVPLGVIGVIYEARPNVTTDIAALALKTGNCAILRGGSETIHTNRELVKVIREALSSCDFPPDAIQFVDSTDRNLVKEMLKLDATIDMIIPRGGAALHRFCIENSTIPVITGGIGICHLYVDLSADQEKSLEVIYNAKTQRPSVCNALDTILVNEAIAKDFIPRVVERLKEVHFKLDKAATSFVNEERCSPAKEGDWDREWLSLTLGIKVVKNLDEAISHIEEHSSRHSDGILTETEENAKIFLESVDSAALYVNASTRFTDGSQMGLGAEVAVSTQKLHARGPMGLKELTTYKWIIRGNYQVRK